MKVTKILKEAIERRVVEAMTEKYSEIQKLQEENRKYRELKQQIIHDLCKATELKILDALHENGFVNPEEKESEGFVYISDYRLYENSPVEEKLDKLRRERDLEVKRKTENIIIALELGGSKKDFDSIMQEELAK